MSRTKIEFICTNCGICFLRIPSSVRNKEVIFCTRKCAGIFQSKKFKGKNNPNFGNKWSTEQKEKQSLIVKSKVNDEYRKNSSKGMKGKSVYKTTIHKRQKTNLEKYGNINGPSQFFSQERKKLIGKKSKDVMSRPEIKKKIKDSNIKSGRWVDDKNKSEIQIYNKLSNWIERMWDKNLIGKELLKDGIYSSKNSKGCVRDHILSRREGYKLGIFPEIIRHPCNCQIISHGKNISKSGQSYITIEKLFADIKSYQESWKEQEKVLRKIEDYLSGERWSKEKYIGEIENGQF